MTPHPTSTSEPVRHLYVHVPFCPTICPFCSFHVLERSAGAVDRYLHRLDEELAVLADSVPMELDTVYLGGGTPSYLRVGEIEALVTSVRRRVGWGSVENTLEVHPSTASPSRCRAWVGAGFDRLSVGAQSFDDEVLRRLGRPHDADGGARTAEWCLAAGATTSVDVVTAVEGQDVAADLATAASLGVHHVSAYTLTVEEGTPYDRAGVEVPDDRAAAALQEAADVLGAAGFERYEVSNHARPGARCAHNLAYWTHRPYLGVGPSASSFLPGPTPGSAVRSRNPDTVKWLAGGRPDVEEVAGRELMADLLLCGLRLADGVDLAAVADRTGVDVRAEEQHALAALSADGLIVVDGDRLRATPAGVMVLDRVAATFL